jgi:hypothetical protein
MHVAIFLFTHTFRSSVDDLKKLAVCWCCTTGQKSVGRLKDTSIQSVCINDWDQGLEEILNLVLLFN